jgi:hypothetical protein
VSRALACCSCLLLLPAARLIYCLLHPPSACYPPTPPLPCPLAAEPEWPPAIHPAEHVPEPAYIRFYVDKGSIMLPCSNCVYNGMGPTWSFNCSKQNG